MTTMIRKQVYITPEQERELKRRAKELGVTEAQLVREGLTHRDRETAVASPAFPDHQAWQDELAFIRERARIAAPPAQRTWTREDLYEERLDRQSSRAG